MMANVQIFYSYTRIFTTYSWLPYSLRDGTCVYMLLMIQVTSIYRKENFEYTGTPRFHKEGIYEFLALKC
jgi:hypothetical protein